VTAPSPVERDGDLPPGTVVGEYHVLRLIGRGGMGAVYQAEQPEIGALVAIKVLGDEPSCDPVATRRFVEEARAVNKIRHPNIIDIFAFGRLPDGRQYFVMEYLDGETLESRLAAGPLPASDARRLLLQICQGLQAVHDERIVHRDLKPENLWIARPRNGEPYAKILDFGIAKLSETQQAPVTDGGKTVGTPHYMSPEQCRGEGVDHRTDLYALGVILYQMFTGRRPFEGPSYAAVIGQQLTVTPVRPSLLRPMPAPLEAVILACLDKDPERRPPSARALADTLGPALELAIPAETLRAVEPAAPPPRARSRRWRRPAVLAVLLVVAGTAAAWRATRSAGGRVLIAVLPFQDLTGDPQQEYFSDGMTEGTISQLSRLQPERLAVIARTSVVQYKGTRKTVRDIGRELSVDYVLEGSVARQTGRLRIDARLVQVSDQTQVWADSYDREVRDAPMIEHEIGRAVTARLGLPVTAAASRLRPVNPEAYDAYLRGRFFFDSKTPEATRHALEYFQRAIAIDPQYALAHTGMADAYATLQMNGGAAPAEVEPKAKAAALRALALDDGLAEAHVALAYVLLNYDWDWAGADQHYRRALALDPSNVEAHRRYGMDYLSSVGRHDEAIAELRQALRLAPFSLPVNMFLGNAYYMAHRYQQAQQQLQRTVELDPAFWAPHLMLSGVHAAQGRPAEALAELEKVERAYPGSVSPQVACALARAGRTGEARAALARLEEDGARRYVPAALVARVHLALGDRDQAFAALDRAFQERSFWLIFLKVDPIWDPLRADPRFAALVRRVGIP
jgi:TolB-like protein/tetratricopeptide (TPR) repeat protein